MHSFKRAGVMALGALLALQLSAAEAPTDPSGFVNGATQAGLLEVQLAQMALTTSSNPAVKQFATRMVADHGAANLELAAIAKAKGITVPAALDAEHSKMMHALHGQTGKAFDTAYASHMVQDHAAALELFQANVSHPDGELATFAGRHCRCCRNTSGLRIICKPTCARSSSRASAMRIHMAPLPARRFTSESRSKAARAAAGKLKIILVISSWSPSSRPHSGCDGTNAVAASPRASPRARQLCAAAACARLCGSDPTEECVAQGLRLRAELPQHAGSVLP